MVTCQGMCEIGAWVLMDIPLPWPVKLMPASSLDIQTVPREEWVVALWMLFGREEDLARRERVTATCRAVREGSLELTHLLEARRAGERVAVAWGQLLAGKNANIWPPVARANEPLETLVALQSELDRRLSLAGLVMAQSLLSPADREVTGVLAQCGYQQLAALHYLHAPRSAFPTTAPAGPWLFQPFQPEERPRLGRLLEATYEATQDAPGLEGYRQIEDVIDGYQATGDYRPGRWFLLQENDQDIGCLLLTEHPGLDTWELIYMGLVRSARGRGLGRVMANYALWQGALQNAGGMLVTVDANNLAAQRVYQQCGFQPLEEREVWVRRLFTPPEVRPRE